MARKIVKIIAVIFVATVLIHLVLHSISYHEENNYSEIQSIQYSKCVEISMDKKFVSADDVKQIENKIGFQTKYVGKNYLKKIQLCLISKVIMVLSILKA